MAVPRLYLDACCIIEVIKSDLGAGVPEREPGVDMLRRILKAGRDEKLIAFTSLMSVAEVVGSGDRPVDELVKQRIERLMMSGRDGLTVIGLTPTIVTKARDLAWSGMGKGRAADRIHVAAAMYAKAQEFHSWDNRLGKKLNKANLDGLTLIDPSSTQILPSEYRENDLFQKNTDR